MSIERLWAIHRTATDQLAVDAELRGFAIWTLAMTAVWRRTLLKRHNQLSVIDPCIPACASNSAMR
jgi:hypothetical protein